MKDYNKLDIIVKKKGILLCSYTNNHPNFINELRMCALLQDKMPLGTFIVDLEERYKIDKKYKTNKDNWKRGINLKEKFEDVLIKFLCNVDKQ